MADAMERAALDTQEARITELEHELEDYRDMDISNQDTRDALERTLDTNAELRDRVFKAEDECRKACMEIADRRSDYYNLKGKLDHYAPGWDVE